MKRSEKGLRSSRKILLAVLMTVLLTMSFAYAAVAGDKTYTSDVDFNEGSPVGINIVNDSLQLSQENVTLPFIWIPNMKGTVSKVNTETGKELGRYYVVPPGVVSENGSPSRTTVDLNGNCWVGCRTAGTAVKIGLFEAGQWIDRNGDGICQTSQDLNNDGIISGSEILPWGQDECVLYEVVLIPGKIGTYVPGTYTGGYSAIYPRAVAIDKNDNVWVGVYNTKKYYYINGSNGQIVNTVDVSSYGHTPYGAVIDKNGILWSSCLANHVLRIDSSTGSPSITKINLSHMSYGIGLDYLGHLFVSGWTDNKISRINLGTGAVEWTKNGGASGLRGVACTSDNNVWVAGSYSNSVTRYDNEGNLLATIAVGSHPTGVAVDTAGKVWACDLWDDNVHRINPATNKIDLTKTLSGSSGHYSVSVN